MQIIPLNAKGNLFIKESFVRPLQAKEFIHLAQSEIMHEVLVVAEDGPRTHEARTGASCWIRHNHTMHTLEVCQMISDHVGIPLSHAEQLNIVRYTPGQRYIAHHDTFDPERPESAAQLKNGGQRICTAILYLNDVQAGGETEFPNFGFDIYPAAGQLLTFDTADRDTGAIDQSMLHGGKEVSAGEKWIATLWFRQNERNQHG